MVKGVPFSAKLIAGNEDPYWAIAELYKMDALMPEKYYIKFFLGTCHITLNEPTQALRYFEAALNLDQGRLDRAEVLARQAVGLCRGAMSPDRSDLADELTTLAKVLRAQGRSDEAEAVDREVSVIRGPNAEGPP